MFMASFSGNPKICCSSLAMSFTPRPLLARVQAWRIGSETDAGGGAVVGASGAVGGGAGG
jgi:hypothetical protein